jgi:hypothetical protein
MLAILINFESCFYPDLAPGIKSLVSERVAACWFYDICGKNMCARWPHNNLWHV